MEIPRERRQCECTAEGKGVGDQVRLLSGRAVKWAGNVWSSIRHHYFLPKSEHYVEQWYVETHPWV